MNLTRRLAGDLLGSNTVGLIDAGASGGLHPRWAPFGSCLHVYGFEPDPAAYRKLPREDRVTWFDTGLAGIPGERTLFVTRSQTNTSLLRPNRSVVERLHFSDRGGDHEIEREVRIKCETLDSLASREKLRAEFLKIDTQGSELEILEAGERLLRDQVVLVEVEVEFVPLYTDQPLFSDVDRFLRGCGFELLDLGNLLYLKPRGCAGQGGPKGQLVSADALYVKVPDEVREMQPIASMALVVGLLSYGYPELALERAEHLPDGKSSFRSRLREEIPRLRHPSKLVEGVPGARGLVKLAEKASRHLGEVSNAKWLNPLGNRLL